jgi:alkylated DNA repair dioxygenase AlkB
MNNEILSLFPVEPAYPEGFSYSPDFLSKEEELELLDAIKKQELHTFIFQGYEAKRKVASFGFDYSFDHKRLSAGKPIPADFFQLLEKVAVKLNIKSSDFKELLIIEYPVGSVINWHRDAPPFDIIVGISLLSDCTFKLRPHDKEKQVKANTISLTVKPRSLYVMKGEARSDWQHSTLPVKNVRYSITLRTLKDKK